MAKCDLCGADAGFFRKRHKSCENQYQAGWVESVRLVAKAALESAHTPSLESQLAEIARRSYIKPYERKKILIEGWQQAVDTALEDGVLTAEEEDSLTKFGNSYSLSQEDLNTNGAHTRFVQAGVIREILEGKLPQRVTVEGNMPFNFQKSETLVWLFQNVTLYELRTRIRYEGSSQGISVRVAKGVYYRAGGFRGNPVPTTTAVNLGQGLLAVTDKHIYFAGTKIFRIRYDRIVSFTPYDDGIGIQRDAQTAKPQVFITGDGWFVYNLVTNLASRTRT